MEGDAMAVVEIAAFVVLGYAGFVAVMELGIGLLQPEMETGVVLATTDARGAKSSRTLAGFELDGKLYVSSNHWLRGWYREALARPEVEVRMRGVQTPRIAVPVVGAERDRLADAYRMGFVLRFICGFAPSRFLRLDPLPEAAPRVAVPEAVRRTARG